MQPVRVVSIPPRQAMMLPRGRCIARGEQKTVHDIYIYIIIYIYICVRESNYKGWNKVRDHTRSMAPVPYLFEGSVPYLCSIRYYIYIYILMIGCIYIYIFEHVQSDFTFVRTYMSAHTYMSAYMQEYVYYAQAL